MAKIMLVEDDRSLQEIYSIRLVAEGYEIARADDGEEALAKAVQEKPDLIIADVMMPKISGFDMLDILRSQPETQNIKVIMMTALSSDDQRQRGEALGAERYLVKSQVGIEDVINAVHEVLGDRPSNSAKASIDTLSNVPKPQENSASEATSTPSATTSASLEGVKTTLATNIQPTNPAAGPAPGEQTPNSQDGAMPSNFNQAPAAMPGTVPTVQPVGYPATGVSTIPAAQMTNETSTIIPPAQQMTPETSAASPLPLAPLPITGTAVQTTNRILPNAQLSAAIQAAESAARMKEENKVAEEQKPNGGERVIQPIHDPRMDDMRNEMQQRMEEILGNDTDTSAPQEINTKTARKTTLTQQQTSAETQTTTRSSEVGLPPEIEQDPIEQVKNVKLPPDTSTQQDLVRNQLATQSERQDEELAQPTIETQDQEIQTETEGETVAEQTETEEETVAEQTEQTEQETTTDIAMPQDPIKPTLTNEDDKVIEAIQPGYISQLEDDLSEDAGVVASDSMAARMANELKDDGITKEAQIKAETAAAEEAKKAEMDSAAMAANHSDVIEHALESVATISPNTSESAEQSTSQPIIDSTSNEVDDIISH